MLTEVDLGQDEACELFVELIHDDGVVDLCHPPGLVELVSWDDSESLVVVSVEVHGRVCYRHGGSPGHSDLLPELQNGIMVRPLDNAKAKLRPAQVAVMDRSRRDGDQFGWYGGQQEPLLALHVSIFQARRHRVHAARSSGARETWLVRNWVECHRDYERPGSSLSQRLQVV